MTDLPITALRVANEAFLVASTIERCPKTMMLRELVMNALEAAGDAPAGQRRVDIKARLLDGTRKLCIWNAGPGMTAAELHGICDLASSLHKQNGLDRNFGMGAKVASLPSNKLGLRYRSCREGVVSEVMMGQRGGVYGRIPYRSAATPVEAEVADVTEACRAEGDYDLGTDWTEVVLYGNRAGQDTLLDPYDGDPAMPAGWIGSYLSHRFFRVADGTALVLRDGAAGPEAQPFRPMAARLSGFTQVESVAVPGGIVLHYAYDARPTAGEQPEEDGLVLSSQGGVVHRGEIYAARQAQDWVLDAPLFGMPFGARHYAVFVELPDDYGVRPDLYRQFLRFQHGDQRQVYLGDFAGLVRQHIPAWLRDIIASYGPPQADYLGELQGELASLLEELGIEAQPRGPAVPRGQEPPPPAGPRPPPAAPSAPRADAPPPRKRFEVPPELIGLSDPAQIDERGLQGRAARFFPATHQIFLNLTYPAITRMAVQLEQAFESAAPAATLRDMAVELSQWAATRRISRAVVFSLGKKAAGWQPDEIARAQSPESLSIVADDYGAQFAGARRRMAERLGLPAETETTAGATPAALQAQRLAAELATAQQAARRAVQTRTGNPVPFLRRVSEIEAQRRNMDAALDWARQAIEADPKDAWSYNHLSGLLQQLGRLEEAEAAADRAFGAATETAMQARFLRQVSSVAQQRRDMAKAMDYARRAIGIEPEDAWSQSHLANLLVQERRWDDAEQVTRRAVELATDATGRSRFLRQLSTIAQQRRDLPVALDYARQAIDAKPDDAWSHSHLANLLMQQEQLDAAEDAVRHALAMTPDTPAPFLRQLSNIAQRRQRWDEAVNLARRSLAANTGDAWSYNHLANLLQQVGELEEAETLALQALELSPANAAQFMRQISGIVERRKDWDAAIDWARKALEADGSDAWSHSQLANLLMQQGQLNEAERSAKRALELSPADAARFLRQLSNIAQRRKAPDQAIELAHRSIDADRSDPWSYSHLANLLVQRDALGEAEQAVCKAIELSARPAAFLRQLSTIAQRRQDLSRALQLAHDAVAADPVDTANLNHLSQMLRLSGDFDAAKRVALEGLELSRPVS